MGFWDKFKRKKAVLIHEESQTVSSMEGNSQPAFQVQQATASSAQVLSQGVALKAIKRKKRAKKRRIMKKSSHAKVRHVKKTKKSSSAHAPKVGDGSTNKWMHKERALLDAALRDLNRELSGLRSSRRKLETKMSDLSDNLGTTQTKEISLRTQISELMKKEATLSKKKATAKDKIVDIDQKIEKVRSIQADLKSV